MVDFSLAQGEYSREMKGLDWLERDDNLDVGSGADQLIRGNNRQRGSILKLSCCATLCSYFKPERHVYGHFLFEGG